MLLARPNSPRPIGPALRTLLTLHFTHSQVCFVYYNTVNLLKNALEALPILKDLIWRLLTRMPDRSRGLGGKGAWCAQRDACGPAYVQCARVESAGARVREGSEARMARQMGPTVVRVAMYGSELYR